MLLSFIGLIVKGLICDGVKETLIDAVKLIIIYSLGCTAIVIPCILQDKNKIDWKSNHDLLITSVWIYIASWSFLFITAMEIISPCIQIKSTGSPNYSLALIYFIISIFSFWTYFSLILGKRNALFLLRSYFVLSISCYISCLIKFCTRLIPDIDISTFFSTLNFNSRFLSETLSLTMLCAIIALCIKGLIISFRPHIVELFKESKIRFFQIFIVTLLAAAIIAVFTTNITYTKTPAPEYPALNISK